MHLLHVVGARPNFMKVAPVIRAFRDRSDIEQTLVHTGQHYDPNLSDIFFEQLEIPRPDVSLEVGSGSHAKQTAEIMIRFEETVLKHQPDWVMVYGDINSTVAAALVAAKLGIKVAHVEAGLRSFDREMPEELNRLVTDQLSDLLLTTSPEAEQNLANEGVPGEKVHFVGNVMIDTVRYLVDKATMPSVPGLSGEYSLLTMHRPSNVDVPETLTRIIAALKDISEQIPIVFPIHPRTKARIETLDANVLGSSNIIVMEPVGYLESLALQKHAKFVMTDSGGLQEETTALGVPCLTIRENTERPITVTEGTNTLVGTDMDHLRAEVNKILAGDGKAGRIPEKWDGHAAERIVEVLASS
ncbi:MAG: UDP-N-acetylglucosamine 2-epimerase (non-hydrolyzing) [Planctomycetaceae bacterium]|nr:UDP-N-acetylglucosamine 2-epimerase (non-hydrolyzing) [Planctomycetaceae bacterium]